jgi:hypothetical protein
MPAKNTRIMFTPEHQTIMPIAPIGRSYRMTPVP